MRVVIVGAGGVGGLLGALLLRAGAEVAFVARGEQLRALKGLGLRVTSPLGAMNTGPLEAAEDPGRLAAADLVLVAVKAWQVRELAPLLRPLLREGTLVLPVQNGVEAADDLAAALGEGPVVGAVLHVLSRIEAPGQILHEGLPPRFTVGERKGAPKSDRLGKLIATLKRAGIEAKIAPDIAAVLWEKLLFVEPLGSVGAVARAPVGALRTIPETRALLAAAMHEIASVARAAGAGIAPDAAEQALARVEKLDPAATVSMARDIEDGRPSELLDQTGAVVRVGKRVGTPTPVHDFLLGALLPQEQRARR
jgi:2-dehydropantoate 2-reductase